MEDDKRWIDPELYPSLMKSWVRQGGTEFQKLFGRLRDEHRWINFFENLPGLQTQARFRGTIGPLCSNPLRTLPNNIEGTFGSADFQWFMCNRVQNQQPAAEDITEQYCSCIKGKYKAKPIGDGRHFRRCRYHNVMTRIHDTIRDLLHLMARSAGLMSIREPNGLLPDCQIERPADWFITG